MLSHPDMRIPEQGHIYSVNEGYWQYWDEATREAVNWFHTCESQDGKPYSSRYVGALVADFHRTLIYGGIYMYPPDAHKPDGQAAPDVRGLTSFVPGGTGAGGKASDGRGRILERKPERLHARTPLFIGSRKDVEAVERTYAQHAKA